MDQSELRKAPLELLPGARNAVRSCMAVGGGDRVVVIGERDSERIDLALLDESQAAGAEAKLLLLEDFGQRPFTTVPPGLEEALKAWRPTVSFYAAGGLKGELPFRIRLRRTLIDDLNVRHGHMINIDERLMQEGMLADYRVVAQVTQRVTDLVHNAQRIHVSNPKGTTLKVTFSPDLRWKPCPGIYHNQGEWGNLPEGETYTCPAGIDGTVVAEVLGDYFGNKYGVLEKPAVFEVVGGRVVQVRCDDGELQQELREYLATGENSDRVGEFAIGSNLWVKHLTGNLLQDEKIPGVHVAFGDSYPEETGATWSAQTHVDVIPTECTIEVDGRVLMREGRFEPDVLAGIEGLPE